LRDNEDIDNNGDDGNDGDNHDDDNDDDDDDDDDDNDDNDDDNVDDMSATMQAQRRDDRALKMDVRTCARMSWGLHGGQWQKLAADNGVYRGRNNQPLMRVAKAVSGWQ
jgi:hypothetical protein